MIYYRIMIYDVLTINFVRARAIGDDEVTKPVPGVPWRHNIGLDGWSLATMDKLMIEICFYWAHVFNA